MFDSVELCLGFFFLAIGVVSLICMLISPSIRNFLRGKIVCSKCGSLVNIPTESVVSECPKCGEIEIWF